MLNPGCLLLILYFTAMNCGTFDWIGLKIFLIHRNLILTQCVVYLPDKINFSKIAAVGVSFMYLCGRVAKGKSIVNKREILLKNLQSKNVRFMCCMYILFYEPSLKHSISNYPKKGKIHCASAVLIYRAFLFNRNQCK